MGRRKKHQNEEEEESYSWYDEGGTEAQRYYARHPEYIPFGCSACGNSAYPECKDSCPMYDDD